MKNLNKKKMGQTELETAPIIFGGNVFGWTVDEKMTFILLDKFIECGFNCIDTANIYSNWVPGNQGGESESIIGKWMKQRNNRDQIIIATKVGMEMKSEKGLSKKYIFQAIDDSLKRLQIDYIDLYQAHEDDTDTPLEETLAAFTELHKQGKVRFIGASNYSAQRLEEAHQVSQKNNLLVYQVFQPLYNLYDRSAYEAELEAVCKKYQLGVITYFSLASGFLSGKYHTKTDLKNSARKNMLEKYFDSRGIKILNTLNNISQELNTTPTKLAIAWLLAQSSVTAPIVSATNIDQLNDVMDAVNLKLNNDVIHLLNVASAS